MFEKEKLTTFKYIFIYIKQDNVAYARQMTCSNFAKHYFLPKSFSVDSFMVKVIATVAEVKGLFIIVEVSLLL